MDEKIEGKLREVEGKLTGDKVREGQGKAESAVGEAKEKAEDIGTEAERRWQDARESA
jgi:uncharacterized protein YjbJ (UPF0337 family)